MKKGFAILLLSVYLFNLAGYSLWFQHLIAQSDSEFVKQIDISHYNEAELVEVKVPLNMPYITNTGAYERVDGQLEHDGIHYNYVKRKVSNDTLYILCLPNESKTKLYNAKAAYSKEANDIPSNKKAAGNTKKSGFDTEQNRLSDSYMVSDVLISSGTEYPSLSTARLHNIFIAIPEQPPKASC